METDIAVLSQTGGRTRNEDACGYWTSDKASCWVLSDGAGGHGGGDVAAKLTVSTVLRLFSQAPTFSAATLAWLLDESNQAVLAEQQTHEELQDMRATVTILIADPGKAMALLGHMGDSRIYCFRGGGIHCQTRDHSVVQSMVDAGLVGIDALRNHPRRNVLLHALGSVEDFAPTVTDQPLPILPGDAFLLCSDGLWEHVDEAAMLQARTTAGSAREWLDLMESELLRHASGSHDNYSAVAVWFATSDDATLPLSS